MPTSYQKIMARKLILLRDCLDFCNFQLEKKLRGQIQNIEKFETKNIIQLFKALQSNNKKRALKPS